MVTDAAAIVRAAAQATHAVCPISSNPRSCKKAWHFWRAKMATPVSPTQVAALHALLPQINQAIHKDAQVAEAGNARLGAIAKQISRIYQTPQNY